MLKSCAEKISDPEHPKRKTSIALKVILLITTILGVVVLAVSAYYIYSSKGLGGFAAIILILGIGIVGFSIVGMCGSGYHYETKSSYKLLFLRIFWLAIFIVAGVLLLVGAVCVLSSETIEYYVIMNLDSFQESIDELPESSGKTQIDRVTSLVGNVIGVGVMAIITGLILIIPFLLASYLMGARIFLGTVGMFGCIVIAILGIGTIALAGYFYNYMSIAREYSGILMGVIVLGIFLIVLGIFGVIAFSCERKNKWPIRIFAGVLIAMLLAFLILAIVAFASLGSLKAGVDKGVQAYCGDDGDKGEDTWKDQIENSDCFKIVSNIVNYLCDEGSKEGVLDPCPEVLKPEKCNCNNLEVKNLSRVEFFGLTQDYVGAVLSGNYMVVGVIGFVIVLFLTVMLVTVFATSICYKTDSDIEKMDLETGGRGTHGDLLLATPHGFMKWQYKLDRLLRFKSVLNNYRLDSSEVFKYADECMSAFRELGREQGKEGGAERAAQAIDNAMHSNPDNVTQRARQVCDTCVNIYSQIATNSSESIGFIYVEVNRRLRNTKSVSDDKVDTLKKVVHEACGTLDSYVFLLWEGLKLMFASDKSERCVYRGMRIPVTAHKALCAEVGHYIILPAFSSFSVKKSVALGFPGTPPEPNTVDVMLELQAYGRPLIEDMVYTGVQYEREVLIHPFSAFKVISCSNGKDERPTIYLSDVEVVQESKERQSKRLDKK